jgi:hypothetical protein
LLWAKCELYYRHKARSVYRGLNSYNFGIRLDFDHTTVGLLNNLFLGSSFLLLAGLFEQNFYATEQIYPIPQLSRQKLSASPPQIYLVQAACLQHQPFS